jgi:O-antigen/teichoic acid export membrane protein
LLRKKAETACFYIKHFFTSGHPRSQNLKKNIVASFVLKAISIILSLIKVPILLAYLNSEKYGVWLTIASILDWMSIFDLGLGHGFRNRFAEAIAINDQDRAKGLVSTAYTSMSAIMLFVFLIAVPVILLLNWGKILNTNLISEKELKITVLMVTAVFAARFVLQLVTVMLKALQKPALSDVFLPVTNALILILIPILGHYIKNSLFWASAVIAIPPVLVLLIANYILFKKYYKTYKPTLYTSDKIYLKDIYSLGWKFFVGQICGLILFSSANIILTQAVNPSEVTIYNIAYKYFSLPISYFMIIITPYWSAVTDAYYKDEFNWIKNNMRKILYIACTFCFVILGMLLVSKLAFHIWIQDRVKIPLRLSLTLTLYNIFVVFMSPFSMFLNGFGKLKLGTIVAPAKTVIFLPLAWYLSTLWGATGLVVALFIANILPNLYFEIRQYSLLVNQKAYGIWNK